MRSLGQVVGARRAGSTIALGPRLVGIGLVGAPSLDRTAPSLFWPAAFVGVTRPRLIVVRPSVGFGPVRPLAGRCALDAITASHHSHEFAGRRTLATAAQTRTVRRAKWQAAWSARATSFNELRELVELAAAQHAVAVHIEPREECLQIALGPVAARSPARFLARPAKSRAIAIALAGF